MDANDRKKRASAEAADWFARLQSGEMDRTERYQYVEWLRESYVHVIEMLRIVQIHGELKQFKHWGRLSTGPKIAEDSIVQLARLSDTDVWRITPQDGARSDTKRKVVAPRLMFLAASVMAILLLAITFVLPRLREQVIDTERGERREVVLSDGTVLEVDPETRLRVKYADEVRRVVLEHGRALFRVAKNANRPFLVRANDTTVRAVGTAFGVEQKVDGVVVTVAEGKVAVFSSSSEESPNPNPGLPPSSLDVHRHQLPPTTSPPSQGAAEGRGEALPSTSSMADYNRMTGDDWAASSQRVGGVPNALFLTADQQVTVPIRGAPEAIRDVDSERALAWAQGRLIFENDELRVVIAEFNRYNRVQLAVTDPELAIKPVSGVFNAADPEAFLVFLQSVTTVLITREGDKRIAIAIDHARGP